MERTGTRTIAKVYLEGDGLPLWCDDTPEGVLDRLSRSARYCDDVGITVAEYLDRSFVHLPLLSGETAYARPRSIALVLPHEYDPDVEADD